MGFKAWMTAIASGAFLLALGVASALRWSGALQPEPRQGLSAQGGGPSLVLVSPLPAAHNTDPQRRMHADEATRPEPDRIEQPSNPPARRLRAAPKDEGGSGARLAIVIDDLGYNLSVPNRLLALELPVTFSIIPQERYSREIAERVRRAGREFLIHLPMEPQDYPGEDPGPNALLLGLDEETLRVRLTAQLDSLPGALGANNHMGSAFTSDARRMEIVQATLAQRGLVFLNSKTSATHVPGEIARARGYAYLERDVFLDNERSEVAIRAQLDRAIARAREQGQAIAIGHPYPETLRVLRERLPRLSGEGVLLVPISEL